MDEVLEKKQAQKDFEEKVVSEQEVNREQDIEETREQKRKLKEEGDTAQQSLSRNDPDWGGSEVFGDDTDVKEDFEEESDELELEVRAQAAEGVGEVATHNAGIVQAVKSFLKDKGHDVEEEDVEKLKEKPPEPHVFPMVIFGFAVLKDFLDFGDATFVLILFKFFYVPLYIAVMTFWVYSRAERFSFTGKLGVRIMRKAALKRLAGTAIVEAIPFLSILPLATVFMLLNNYAEKKVVKLFQEASEMVARGDIDIDEVFDDVEKTAEEILSERT